MASILMPISLLSIQRYRKDGSMIPCRTEVLEMGMNHLKEIEMDLRSEKDGRT